MSDKRVDQRSPAEIHAASSELSDDRAPAVWTNAARDLGLDFRFPAKHDFHDLLRAKGWHPLWGRYLLTHKDSRLTTVRRQPGPDAI